MCILTINDHKMQTLCILEAPGAKIGTDAGSRLAIAQEEQFGKCEVNPFFTRGSSGGHLSLNVHCLVR